VDDDSPAASAGLEAGDVVVEFDGEKVRGARQFVRLVQETPSGREVPAVVLREGQRVTLTVTPRDGGFQYFSGDIGDLVEGVRTWARPAPPVPPAPPAAAPPRPPAPPLPPDGIFEFDDLLGRVNGRLGLRVSAIEAQLGEYFGTKGGVLVTSVESDSPAGRAGVKAGDVVLSIDGRSVSSPAELRREAQRLGANQDFSLEIVRDRKTTTVKGKTDEAPRRRTRTIL
jgi:serine protease Do